MKIIIFAIVLFLVNLNSVYAASSLSVEKLVENQDIKVGDDVKILLKFTNPFGQELPIKIVDKNIFGNNGMDIQCMEYTLPKNNEILIAYDPIKPFSAGNYILDSAEVTYTNPYTGKQETIKSNSLEIKVKDSGQQGQAKGITTIYRCNGINMQSTSYSSSRSSFNIQIGGSNIQSNQISQQGSPQDRVQNNQMNQNTNALKQQMEKQIQQQRRIEQEFQKNLADNKEFQREHQKLLEQGYNLTDASFNPNTNNTGSFELSYQKPTGEKATLKGEMENGELKNIMSLTAEDKQRILTMLQKNEKFQKYDYQLVTSGFNKTQPIFNQLTQNYTQISIPYKKGIEENKITADYINGTIQNVKLENSMQDNQINIFWIFLLAIILGIIGWFLYTKYWKKTKQIQKQEQKQELKVSEKPLNYKKEAKKMIERAKKLFDEKKEKDAYEKVSQTIRFYFSHKLGIKKEIINSDLLNYLKNKKGLYLKTKKCLDLCALVEFAKYKPNKKDFADIIIIAEELIGE